MNTFQFAIASIVDANTGNGLVYTGAGPDYNRLEERGRRIRSQSFHGLVQAFKGGIASLVEAYRAKAQMRRDLKLMLSLNDHLLDDIGLHRNDLYMVQNGAVRLDDLINRNRSRRQDGQ